MGTKLFGHFAQHHREKFQSMQEYANNTETAIKEAKEAMGAALKKKNVKFEETDLEVPGMGNSEAGREAEH